MTAPVDELTQPVAQDPVPDVVENIVGGTQFISAAWWLGNALALTGIPNPWQWVADQYAGDWPVVQRAGIALANLDEFGTAVATTTTTASDAAQRDWDGRAADAAGDYFTGLAGAVRDQAAEVRGVAREFEQLAVGMYETAASLKGLLEALVDELIVIGLDAAAALVSTVTVVGPILAGAAAVVSITRAIGIWGDVLRVHNHVWTVVQGFVGAVAGYLSALQDLEQHALPAAYDHPRA